MVPPLLFFQGKMDFLVVSLDRSENILREGNVRLSFLAILRIEPSLINAVVIDQKKIV
jgi:hypothetical protein